MEKKMANLAGGGVFVDQSVSQSINHHAGASPLPSHPYIPVAIISHSSLATLPANPHINPWKHAQSTTTTKARHPSWILRGWIPLSQTNLPFCSVLSYPRSSKTPKNLKPLRRNRIPIQSTGRQTASAAFFQLPTAVCTYIVRTLRNICMSLKQARIQKKA